MEHQHLESLYPADSRFEEISQLSTFIKDGKSCQLIGMPGIGRGNICQFLSYNHDIRVKHFGEEQTQFHFVFINFAEVKSRPLGDVIKFIFLELVSSLHERRLEEAFTKTDTIFKKALLYKDDLVLFQGLKDAIDYLVYEKNLHVILTFERLELYIPLLTDDFFVHLRSLRERAKYKFSVVFSLTRPLEDMVEPKVLADFYEFFAGHTVYVKLYDAPGIIFRIEYLQQLAGEKLPKHEVDLLIQVTGGHGKLMRLGCEALLAGKKEYKTEKELASFLLSQKTIRGALTELTSFLTPSEIEILCATPKEAPSADSTFLHTIDLLSQKSVNTIPLFATFLSEKPHEVENTNLSYDPQTNIIKRGNMILSEKLTGGEFRLLKFLLQNPNTILDRETIISAVWKETATTAGVTDQAVDQLIFRVRKKIEKDPNNPVHIQTIKGRGIKFTP